MRGRRYILLAKKAQQVVPYDLLNAELMYPQGSQIIATYKATMKMAIEIADFILMELQDLKKAMHN